MIPIDNTHIIRINNNPLNMQASAFNAHCLLLKLCFYPHYHSRIVIYFVLHNVKKELENTDQAEENVQLSR